MSKGFNHTGYTQEVTYWGSPVSDGLGGKTFASPVALKARWENKQEQFHMLTGELTVSNAVVYLQQAVALGGYLYLGTSVAASPFDVEGAWPIRGYVEIPDLRVVSILRKAML
jgi:hypothetical protein